MALSVKGRGVTGIAFFVPRYLCISRPLISKALTLQGIDQLSVFF